MNGSIVVLFVRECFLEFAWPAASRATLRRRARRGDFGPVYSIPGQSRAKHFSLAAVEAVLGELTPAKRADALRRYEAARQLRRPPIVDYDEWELELVS
jgi:hypothetical protein